MRIPLFDFDEHRIIMESYYSFQGAKYLFFPEGVPHFHLYRSSKKINSFSELQYVAEKFIYLNPDFDIDRMKRLFVALSDRESGHIVRTYSAGRVENMVEYVSAHRKQPYYSRLRKIVFNPGKMITREEKRKIIGELIGVKDRPEPDEIEQVISDLYTNHEKITIKRVAQELNSTPYLIRYYFGEEELESIRIANRDIRYEKQVSKAVGVIDQINSEGKKLKMRKLKELTSIRNYQALKEAVNRYQLSV